MTLARFLRDGHTHYPEKMALIFGEHAWTAVDWQAAFEERQAE